MGTGAGLGVTSGGEATTLKHSSTLSKNSSASVVLPGLASGAISAMKLAANAATSAPARVCQRHASVGLTKSGELAAVCALITENLKAIVDSGPRHLTIRSSASMPPARTGCSRTDASNSSPNSSRMHVC